jgi:hypothetical protein
VKTVISLIILIAALPSLSCAQQISEQSEKLKGAYLGQTPPGERPEIFAKGIISKGTHELDISFSPDKKYLFFSTFEGQGQGSIYWVDAKIIENLKKK